MVWVDFLSHLIFCSFSVCSTLSQVFPPVPHLIHLLLHKNTQTSCLLALPHSQGTQPKKPSRHPVTSQSQPCDKTWGFLMITTWWYSKSHTLDSYSNSIVNMKSQTAHTKNILMHFRSWASIWRIRTKQLPHLWRTRHIVTWLQISFLLKLFYSYCSLCYVNMYSVHVCACMCMYVCLCVGCLCIVVLLDGLINNE